MTPEDLMQIQGVGEKTVERIRRVVTDYFERDQSGEGPVPEAGAVPGEGDVTGSEAATETSDLEAHVPDSVAGEGVAEEEQAEGGEAATLEEPAADEQIKETETSGEGEPVEPGESGVTEAGGEEK